MKKSNSDTIEQLPHDRLINMPSTQGESNMSYVPIPELQDIRTFEDEPIMSRKAYSYGIVNIYAPDAPSEEWADRAWLITSELDGTGNPPGIRVEIKAEAVADCLAKPYFIDKGHKFV